MKATADDHDCPACGLHVPAFAEAAAEVERLRALLKRCESGSKDADWAWCPICDDKWIDEPKQPHTDDCELAAALRTTSASPGGDK